MAIGKAKKKKKGIRVVAKLLSFTAWATGMVTVSRFLVFSGYVCNLCFAGICALPMYLYTLLKNNLWA